MAHLAETGVHLEVCPSSNVQTDVVAAYSDHPVDRLHRQGISLGINTDTRTVTDVTLTRSTSGYTTLSAGAPRNSWPAI